ncbi:hypothetical protein GOEFS_044_00050 [Gordonia effusa NBRC 100432]|uniref:Mce-associated membrane protein n=1 Tax=Gordonia effusa NBRC 100432 TaxID=1077974 RepID=H0QYR8_9ACTN|nr:hypothetical protein [Gordonia effusa]GAB17969.1 hypothetical protein GOEFS_044_00050 [Gordonia effusa NBRC 100432]
MIDLDKPVSQDEADVDEADRVEADRGDTDVVDEDPAPVKERTAPKPKRQLTVSLSGLLTGVVGAVVVAVLVVGLVVFAVRDFSARDDLDALRADAAARAHAETIAGQYAVTAATLDYRDLTPWIANMKKGVSDDLRKQYDVIGQAMEQVLTPLRMQTTADLVVAKTIAVNGNMYRVQAVVDVNTKTVQTPNGGSTTAVYAVTLDKGRDWMITSVGDPTSAIGNLNPGGNANTGGNQANPAPSTAPSPTTPAAGG